MPPWPSTASIRQCPRVCPIKSSFTLVLYLFVHPRRRERLAAHEREHRLAHLDLVSLLQDVLRHLLAIHIGAIGAACVAQDEATVGLLIDGGVQTRDGKVLKENVALAAAANRQPLLTHLEDAPWLFALAHDDHAGALRGAAGANHARLLGIAKAVECPRGWRSGRGGAPAASVRRRGRVPSRLAPLMLWLRGRPAPRRSTAAGLIPHRGGRRIGLAEAPPRARQRSLCRRRHIPATLRPGRRLPHTSPTRGRRWRIPAAALRWPLLARLRGGGRTPAPAPSILRWLAPTATPVRRRAPWTLNA